MMPTGAGRDVLPDDPRAWSLAGRGEVKKKGQTVVRQCPACFAMSPAAALRCRECGHEFEGQPREIAEQEGELSEVELARERKQARRAQASAGSLEALIELGRMRGFRDPAGWARHVWEARERKRAER